MGRVEQDNDYGSTSYVIYNDKEQVVSLLKGPNTGCCGCSYKELKSRFEFEITTKDGNFHLGKISKTSLEFATLNIHVEREVKYFGVSFYVKELDVKVKALVLGTLFLLVIALRHFSTI